MNAAKVTLTGTVLAAALGLALGLMATPAQAHHCKGGHAFPGCTSGGGGAGGGGGGGTTPIVANIVSGSALDPDLVGSMYSDSERDIKANAGPGIFINLRGTGNEPRTVLVGDDMVEFGIACSNPKLGGVFIGGADGCDFLKDLDPQTFGVQRPKVILAVSPYAVNCPDPTPPPDENCLDVFTMGVGNDQSIQMGFTVAFHEGVRLDIASAIGGTTAKNPGRCLSVMTEAERIAFLDEFCGGAGGDIEDCNVTVAAMGTDSDGRNNSWDIVAGDMVTGDDTGLICISSLTDAFVIGVATGVTFFIEADVD